MLVHILVTCAVTAGETPLLSYDVVRIGEIGGGRNARIERAYFTSIVEGTCVTKYDLKPNCQLLLPRQSPSCKRKTTFDGLTVDSVLVKSDGKTLRL